MQSVKFYEFGFNSYWIGVVFNKQWEKYYLDITRKYTYTKDNQTKEGSTSTYLNLAAAAALVDQLPGVYQFAKNLQDNQGVEIYRLSWLIFKTLYIFTQANHKWQQQIRLMEWSGTLPLPALQQPTISQTFCWTDADSLELEQTCKDLGISEAETDPLMSSSAPPTQFQLNLSSSPKACLTEAAAAAQRKRESN